MRGETYLSKDLTSDLTSANLVAFSHWDFSNAMPKLSQYLSRNAFGSFVVSLFTSPDIARCKPSYRFKKKTIRNFKKTLCNSWDLRSELSTKLHRFCKPGRTLQHQKNCSRKVCTTSSTRKCGRNFLKERRTSPSFRVWGEPQNFMLKEDFPLTSSHSRRTDIVRCNATKHIMMWKLPFPNRAKAKTLSFHKREEIMNRHPFSVWNRHWNDATFVEAFFTSEAIESSMKRWAYSIGIESRDWTSTSSMSFDEKFILPHHHPPYLQPCLPPYPQPYLALKHSANEKQKRNF